MSCSQCEDLFAAHVDGLLDEAAERQLGEHLAGCEACRMALDETRRLIHRLDEDRRHGGVTSIAPLVMDRIVCEQAIHSRRNGMMKRVVRIAVAAVVLLGLTFALSHGLQRPLGGRIYAAELSAARKQVENARTATWKIAWYQRFSGPASVGSRWFRIKNMDDRYFYKAPGLYRCDILNEDGTVSYVRIEDVASRSLFVINHKTKTATLSRLTESSYPQRGPFANEMDVMRREDLQALGKDDVGGRPANAFRYEFRNGLFGERKSLDLWVDAATKRLVQYQHPGREVLAPAEVVRDQAWAIQAGETLEYQGKTFQLARGETDHGHIAHEIAFDVELDDSLFALVPPAGYEFKTVKPPPITEKDVLEFVAIVVDYYDKTFPDRLPQFAQNSKEDLERLLRAQQAVQKKEGASPAQVKLVEAMAQWYQTGIPGPGPLHVFVTQEITAGTWKYIGKGVKLGDKDRIVGWYQPKGSRTYRVIHGDLSVKDVEAQDLPLPVGLR
jgi:outer membrane lipoprotein-sorting protein